MALSRGRSRLTYLGFRTEMVSEMSCVRARDRGLGKAEDVAGGVGHHRGLLTLTKEETRCSCPWAPRAPTCADSSPCQRLLGAQPGYFPLDPGTLHQHTWPGSGPGCP